MTDDAIERPLLGVVPPPEPDEPTSAERFTDAVSGIREAASWTDTELERLRTERTRLNAESKAKAAALHTETMNEREAINARIRALLADRERYAKLLKIIDTPASAPTPGEGE
jgi:hypothetical protein